MESKTSAYDPLMSSDARDSLADDISNSSADEALLERYQRRREWIQWVPNALIAAISILILLVIGLIFAVLTHKPTDQQCNAQLSVYHKMMLLIMIYFHC